MERLKAALRSVLTFVLLFSTFVLSGVAVVGALLWFDGYLTIDKVERIGEVLREDPRSAIPERAAVQTPAEAQAEIDAARQAMRHHDARWQEEYELLAGSLRTLQEEVGQERARLAADRARLAEERTAFAAEAKARAALETSDAFKNNVRILARLAAKDAAAFVRDWGADEIVRYLRKLRDREAARLLVELEALDATKAGEVRERLRTQAGGEIAK